MELHKEIQYTPSILFADDANVYLLNRMQFNVHTHYIKLHMVL